MSDMTVAERTNPARQTDATARTTLDTRAGTALVTILSLGATFLAAPVVDHGTRIVDRLATAPRCGALRSPPSIWRARSCPSARPPREPRHLAHRIAARDGGPPARSPARRALACLQRHDPRAFGAHAHHCSRRAAAPPTSRGFLGRARAGGHSGRRSVIARGGSRGVRRRA
jgi:hypothetical protein